MQAVLSQARRFNVLVAGRRWRKTSGLVHLAVEGAMAGKEVLWTGPVFDQVRTGWEECERALWDVAQMNQGRMTMSVPGAGRIMFRSLDNPQSARSKTADLVLVDEAGDVDPRAWPEVLRPMLITTGGGAWFVGTPRGLNWFWELFEHSAARDDWMRWQIPTLGCQIVGGQLVREPHPLENDTIPWDELVTAFDETPESTFRQEYMAEFVDSGDAVFKVADVEAMTTGWRGLSDYRGGKRTLTAWDIGRRADATVGITIDWSSVPYQVVAYERFQGLPYPGIQDAINTRSRAVGGRTIVESNGVGDPVIENLDVRVEGFVTTQRSKVDAITALQLLLERGALKADIPQVTRELKAYRWDDRDLVQDCVMALAIAAKHLPRPDRPHTTASVYVPDKGRRQTIIGAKQEF